MNHDVSVARRYSAALFEVARKRGEVDAVSSNLQEVAGTIASSHDLMSVMHHPLLTQQKKRSIVREIFGTQIRPDVENFLFLVMQKNRAVLLPEMVREFERMVDEFRGEADAQVTTATPLSAQQIADLQVALQKRFGVKVRLHLHVDPEVLGGLQVQVGDKLLDATVRTKLTRLSEQLKRVKVS